MSQFPLPRILDFVRQVAPFEALAGNELERLVSKMDIAYFPRGEVILEAGGDPASALFIINSGSVKLSVPDEDGEEMLIDIRGEGDIFGALSLMQGRKAMLNVTVKEDLVAFMLPAADFLPLVENNPTFRRHFSFSLARRFQAARRSCDQHLGQITGVESLQKMAGQMNSEVTELMSTNVLTCSPGDSIQEAARKMAVSRVGSILVMNGNQEPLGMVTDTDLRCRVLAPGLDPSEPVSKVMSSPIMTIPPTLFAFEAMLEMTLHGVHHLVVTDRGRMLGIVSDDDIKFATGSSPVSLVKELDKVTSLKKLYRLSADTNRMLEFLLRLGGSADFMMELMNEFYDRLTLKLLTLTESAMAEEDWGPPPCGYSWLALGAAGRREQAPPPPVESAVLYEDQGPELESGARQWLLQLGLRMNRGLKACGLADSEWQAAADQAQWCRSLSGWRAVFSQMVREPGVMPVGQQTALLDFRPVEGAANFADSMKAEFFAALGENRELLEGLARSALAVLPPIGFVRQFVVERDGGYTDSLNLRKQVLDPLVDAVRALALAERITANSTLDRISGLESAGVIKGRMAGDLRESFRFLVSILIARYLSPQNIGGSDYHIADPVILNSAQRKMLKESFSVIGQLCTLMQIKFKLG